MFLKLLCLMAVVVLTSPLLGSSLESGNMLVRQKSEQTALSLGYRFQDTDKCKLGAFTAGLVFFF